MPEKIGFIGVGRMGSNMARRLKESGYEIAAVYDVNTAGAQTLAQELGCEAAQELKHVTKLSDIIITVVTDDKAMKQIYNGGLLSRSRGKLFINCATISPDVHVWVEEKAENGMPEPQDRGDGVIDEIEHDEASLPGVCRAGRRQRGSTRGAGWGVG